MTESGGLINVGELTKPATVLIEKVSNAVGGIFRPRQIRRIADADAYAEMARARNRMEIIELEQRTKVRLELEEAKKQLNMEAVMQKAIPHLRNDADASKIEDDWIANFFDKCRLISDEEMQRLWGQLLAGEANSPCSYSKRTVNVLASLDKRDAVLFQQLCSFVWDIGQLKTPLIYDTQASVYSTHGVHFDNLMHLESIGLISFGGILTYKVRLDRLGRRVSYFEDSYEIELNSTNDEQVQELDVGHALLTSTGSELARICSALPLEQFKGYVAEVWHSKGLRVPGLVFPA